MLYFMEIMSVLGSLVSSDWYEEFFNLCAPVQQDIL